MREQAVERCKVPVDASRFFCLVLCIVMASLDPKLVRKNLPKQNCEWPLELYDYEVAVYA